MTLQMGRPQREIFGETVAALADTDPRIYVLDGDVGSSTRADIVEKAHPDRYLQMGIAEQNMLGVAAGMATMGLVPFISTFVSFAVVRPLDQVRVLIAQTGANVKITPELRRPVHRPDRHEPHHRGRLRHHARDAGHGHGVAVRRHRGRRGAPLGGRVRGPVLHPAGPRRHAARVRRRPRVRVRQGGDRPRGQRRDADLDRRPDGPDPAGRGPPRRRGRAGPRAPRGHAQAARRRTRSSPQPTARGA